MIIDDEVNALKKARELNPFTGRFEDKFKKFNNILNEFCEIHYIKSPVFYIPENQKSVKWTKNRDGDCRFTPPRIRIKNFSIVTLLHEFKHWLDYNRNLNFDKENHEREWDAIYYSNILFYKVWPERIKNLEEVRDLARKENIEQYVSQYRNKNPSVCAIIDLCLHH